MLASLHAAAKAPMFGRASEAGASAFVDKIESGGELLSTFKSLDAGRN